MNDHRIVKAIGHIDDELIRDAMGRSGAIRGRGAVKWLAAAACLLIVFITVSTVLPIFNSGKTVMIGGIERLYKDSSISSTELAIVYPWEYKTPGEKYSELSFGGVKYYCRMSEIDEQLLADSFGSITLSGRDEQGVTHTETLELRAIDKVDSGRMIAAGIGGRYYVYFASHINAPATLGQLIDTYGLDKNLTLSKFSVNSKGNSEKYYAFTSDDHIWQTLLDCPDAVLNTATPTGNYLSFTFTSEALGVYKRVLYVYESGYIWTNAFDFPCGYFIGADAAKSIIDYAMASSTPTEPEQYESRIAGIVTEIGGGYILIDDSVLCVNERDGMTFKVLTDDFCVSRYIDYVGLDVGDVVVLNFRGEVTVNGDEVTVHGSTSISEGRLIDGDIVSPE